MKYRKRPHIIDAILWEGGDYEVLNDFCGKNWSRADVVYEDGPPDKENVVVWNTKEKQWINLPVGHYLIRGTHGEYYPCDPKVFDYGYEPLEEALHDKKSEVKK